MKKIFLGLILLVAFNSYAEENCKNDISNQFNFIYSYNNNILKYEIMLKNGNLFKYFNKDEFEFPSILGINIEGDNNRPYYDYYEKNNNDINYQKKFFLRKKYDKFYTEDDKFYTTKMFGKLNNSRPLVLPLENNLFLETNHIKKEINIDKFISFLQLRLPENIKYNEQIIKFKIKLIFDSELNSCAVFETQQIKYNLGSKFIYNLKHFF